MGLLSCLTWLVLACQELPRTYGTQSGREIFSDDFERSSLDTKWKPTGPGVAIVEGRLRIENARNHPVWLTEPLPDNVRIEFDAWAGTDEGDIKVEVFGDGRSFAATTSYVATGYVLVFGGWNNSLTVIARKDEHGSDRLTRSEPKVEPGTRYHVVITRRENELRWDIDGTELLTYEDPSPLLGPRNRHFAFSGWEAETWFDNLVIQAL